MGGFCQESANFVSAVIELTILLAFVVWVGIILIIGVKFGALR